MSAEPICGADIVIKALVDQGVDVVFGYPGGAVLPIYDSLFKQNALRHILVRQEGGAVHAAIDSGVMHTTTALFDGHHDPANMNGYAPDITLGLVAGEDNGGSNAYADLGKGAQ